MITRLLVGIGIGVCIGGLMGYFGKCSSGGCPLTANPFRGAIYGGVMGALFAYSFAGANANHSPVGKADATPSEYVIHVNSVGDFQREVTNAGEPCLVDFWAPWCGPCRQLAPIIDNLAEKHQNTAKLCKVNVDLVSELAKTYAIRGIPCVLFFQNGKEVERIVGLKKQQDYERVLDRLIAAPAR